MRSKHRGKKAQAAADSERQAGGDVKDGVAGSALALRSQRRKLVFAGAGAAAAAFALLATLVARRSRD